MNLPGHRGRVARHAGILVRSVMIVALATAVIAIGFGAYARLRPVLTVTEIVEAPVVQAFYATGTLSPVRDYPLKTSVEGIVERLPDGPFIDKGSRVAAGQALLKIVDPELDLLALRAKAELDEKRARADEKTSPVLAEFDARLSGTLDLLELARAEQRRVLRALETRAATQVDLDRAIERVKNLLKEAEGLRAQKATMLLRLKVDLEVAESAYRISLWNLDQQTLRSPIDGVVLDRPASPGTHLNVNDLVLLIADVRPENLVMRAAVDEENMTFVREKQAVQMSLYSYPGRVFAGRVGRIYDKADPQRRTFEVDVSIDQPDDRMSAGMTGELAFVVASKDSAPVAPRQALQGGIIYTVRDGRLSAADVQTGLSSVERVEIISGLAVGDRVVISPVGGLEKGQAVRTTFMDPGTAAGLNKPKPKAIFRGGF